MSDLEIPKDIEKAMKQWSKETGVSTKEIRMDIGTELAEPYLSKIPKKKRIKAAWNAVKAKLAKILDVPVETFRIYVADKIDSKVITRRSDSQKMRIANLMGLAQAVDNEELGDKIFYFKITGVDDATKIIDSMERDESYEIDLGLRGKGDNMLTLSMVAKKSKPKKIDELVDEPEEIFKDLFEHVDLADMSMKLSDDKDDLKIVHGNVKDAMTPTSKKNNRPYGMYLVIDDSMDMKQIKETGGIAIFCDPAQVCYADGAEILALGQIRDGEKGASMSAQMILGVIPVMREIESVEDEDDVPDIDDDLDDDEESFADEPIDEDSEETPDEEDESEEEPEDEPVEDMVGKMVTHSDDDEEIIYKVTEQTANELTIEDDSGDEYECDISEVTEHVEKPKPKKKSKKKKKKT